MNHDEILIPDRSSTATGRRTASTLGPVQGPNQPPSGAASALLTIDELSRLLSIPKGTLYNWVYLRRIPFFKAGRCLRFNAHEVLASLPHSNYNGRG